MERTRGRGTFVKFFGLPLFKGGKRKEQPSRSRRGFPHTHNAPLIFTKGPKDEKLKGLGFPPQGGGRGGEESTTLFKGVFGDFMGGPPKARKERSMNESRNPTRF